MLKQLGRYSPLPSLLREIIQFFIFLALSALGWAGIQLFGKIGSFLSVTATELLCATGEKYSGIIDTLTNQLILIALGTLLVTLVAWFLSAVILGCIECLLVNSARLTTIKTKLKERFKKAKKPLLVVIDDLDRLVPDDLKYVFQLIKANADFDNVVYVLLADHTVLCENLSRAYTEEKDPKWGKDYLEKLVQVPFNVPHAPKERLANWFQDEVKKLFADRLNPELETYLNEKLPDRHQHAFQYYLNTPRKIKRFLNTLEIQITLLLNQDHKLEFNPIDLICLEILRQFESSYWLLLAHQEIRLDANGTDQKYFKRESRHYEKLNTSMAGLSEEARLIHSHLFPSSIPTDSISLHRVFTGPHYQDYFEFNRQNRIETPESSKLLFELTSGNIEQAKQTFAALKQKRQLDIVFTELSLKDELIPGPLLELVMQEEPPIENRDELLPVYTQLAERTLEGYESTEAITIFKRAFEQSSAIQIPRHLLFVKKLASLQTLMTDEDFLKGYLERLNTSLPKLSKSNQWPKILKLVDFYMEAYLDPTELKHIFSTLLQNQSEETIDHFLQIIQILGVPTSVSANSLVIKPIWLEKLDLCFNRDELRSFVDAASRVREDEQLLKVLKKAFS